MDIIRERKLLFLDSHLNLTAKLCHIKDFEIVYVNGRDFKISCMLCPEDSSWRFLYMSGLPLHRDIDMPSHDRQIVNIDMCHIRYGGHWWRLATTSGIDRQHQRLDLIDLAYIKHSKIFSRFKWWLVPAWW